MRPTRFLRSIALALAAIVGSSGLGAQAPAIYKPFRKSGPLANCEWRLGPNGGNSGVLDCWRMDFTDADLSGRDLEIVSFRYSNLRRANFSGSSLDRAYLQCGDVERANFTKAALGFTALQGAVMNWSDFTEADIHHVHLGQWECENRLYTGMLGVNMTRAKFAHTTISIPDRLQIAHPPRFELRRANFTGASLRELTLYKVDLRLSTFRDATLRTMSVEASNAACSDFTNTVWVRPRSNLKFSDFSGTDFTDAKLNYVSFLGTKLTGAIFVRAELTDVLFGDADLTYADFTDAKISGQQDWSGANLSGATWVDGTRCTQGSIGACRTDGPQAAPDPNRSPYYPPGAAYLVDSVADDAANGHPEISSFYLDCPYSKIDYMITNDPYEDAPVLDVNR